MQTCFLIFASVTLSLTSAWAQLPPISYQPLGQVKQFLELSDVQLQTILANNDAYNLFSSDRQTRIQQVRAEIADETGKSPLDPNALGVRYAEIETICRELQEKAATSQAKNVSVLSEAQKSKLKILDDALKLAPVIAEAQNANIMLGSTSAPYGFATSSQGFASFLLGGVIGPVNGCSLPFPAIRAGDFSSAPTNMDPSQANHGSGAAPNRAATRWFNTSGSQKH